MIIPPRRPRRQRTAAERFAEELRIDVNPGFGGTTQGTDPRGAGARNTRRQTVGRRTRGRARFEREENEARVAVRTAREERIARREAQKARREGGRG